MSEESQRLAERMTAMEKFAQTVDRALFGDKENMEKCPGLFSDVRDIKKTVGEVNSNFGKIIWLFVAMLVTQIGNFFFKSEPVVKYLPAPPSQSVSTVTSKP